MKKYIIVMSLLIIFLFPSVALSKPPVTDFFTASDYPTPVPECPFDESEYPNWGYGLTFSKINNNEGYTLTYYSDISRVFIKDYGDNGLKLYVSSNTPMVRYSASLGYDSINQLWFTNGWKYYDSPSGNMSGSYDNLAYISHNIYAYGGDPTIPVITAHPFPVPPVVLAELAGVSLQQIPLLIGGTAQEVLPLGLKVLAIILVISLVVWLLRSFLLHRQ